MEFYVDNIIEVNYEDLANCSFPRKQLFGLKVYKNSVKYEFLIKLSDNPYSKVICFGSGAKQKNHKPPIFHRYSWNIFFKESVIYYNDPTLYLDDELKLGWCVGERSEWYLEGIREILEKIFIMNNIFNKNVLFYGSSGGGFTSILLATFFKTSCLVNNPQFNLKLYNPQSYKDMINVCFGTLSDKELENYECRINAFELFKQERYIPKINYLVNINSYFDIKSQLMPFIQSILEMDIPLTEKLNIIIYSDDNGHNPISKELTIKYIKNILNKMDSEEVVEINEKLKNEIQDPKSKISLFDDNTQLLTQYLINEFEFENLNYCPICNTISTFKDFGKPPRKNAQCPHCNSVERHRLSYVLIRNRFNELFNKPQIKLLHFAPELTFYNIFSAMNNIDYYPVDINPELYTNMNLRDKVDMENIHYADETFDIIYNYQVLARVNNDFTAMSELYRVLKKDGICIVIVPLYNMPKTLEKKEYNTPELRLKYYGQKNHMRKYGLDFKTRLESVGFNVEEVRKENLIKSEEVREFYKLGWETIYICTK